MKSVRVFPGRFLKPPPDGLQSQTRTNPGKPGRMAALGIPIIYKEVGIYLLFGITE
jgi:hypothetical protein